MIRYLLIPTIGALLAACTPADVPDRAAPPPAVAASASPEWVVKTSPDPVADTVARLTEAITAAGASVAAVVDHRASAAKAGLELPETTVVIFGNPVVGTPLMQANPRAGLDLPLKILVWREGEVTRIGYLSAEAFATRYGIAPDHPSVTAMAGALDRLTDVAMGAPAPS